jgi:hypothetical protein
LTFITITFYIGKNVDKELNVYRRLLPREQLSELHKLAKSPSGVGSTVLNGAVDVELRRGFIMDERRLKEWFNEHLEAVRDKIFGRLTAIPFKDSSSEIIPHSASKGARAPQRSPSAERKEVSLIRLIKNTNSNKCSSQEPILSI